MQKNYILFRSHKNLALSTNFQINLNGNKIDRVENTKFLGVFIDEKLNWKNHISYIASKISRNLGILNKVKHK